MRQADLRNGRPLARPRSGWSRPDGLTILKMVPLVLLPCGALLLSVFVLGLDPQRWLLAGALAGLTFVLTPVVDWLLRRKAGRSLRS